MVKNIEVSSLIEESESAIIIDVRSPSEYNHAHIPLAISLPLFNDEERVVVGTTYKQVSRQDAIKIGLEYFGPKMRKMVEYVENISSNNQEKRIFIHCWRGGMRSNAVAWLLDIYGFDVSLLIGGYKAYRNWGLETLSKPYNYKIIGGYTGSKKTAILQKMALEGKSTIDLENLASHKGSAFGHIGLGHQPSQESFENQLANLLYSYKDNDIWIEDESQRIGHVQIIKPMWDQLQKSNLYFIDLPFEERLNNIVEEYGSLDISMMEDAIHRIHKKLGGLETKNAIEFLRNNEIHSCFKILLNYYDKAYDRALEKRKGKVERFVVG